MLEFHTPAMRGELKIYKRVKNTGGRNKEKKDRKITRALFWIGKTPDSEIKMLLRFPFL